MYRPFQNNTKFEVLKSEGSDDMYKRFNLEKDNFIKLDDEYAGRNLIWEKLVNKGYLVFYSFPGHIETCCPDGDIGVIKQFRYRHAEDSRYLNETTYPIDKNNIFVGAGTTVGYKDQTEKWKKDASAFLYLSFLKEKFN
jgi:hypothetical protein